MKSFIEQKLCHIINKLHPELHDLVYVYRNYTIHTGDFTSNIALRAANLLGLNAVDFAQMIVQVFGVDNWVVKINISQQGLINFELAINAYWHSVGVILAQKIQPTFADKKSVTYYAYQRTQVILEQLKNAGLIKIDHCILDLYNYTNPSKNHFNEMNLIKLLDGFLDNNAIISKLKHEVAKCVINYYNTVALLEPLNDLQFRVCLLKAAMSVL